MTTLVPVLYVCIRLADFVSCDSPAECEYLTQSKPRYEFRTRLEKPLACRAASCCEDGPCLCSQPGVEVCETRQPFADGDWQCKPMMEFEEPKR